MISADKLGRCAFACVGLAVGPECAANVNDDDVVVRNFAPGAPGT